MGLSHSRNYRKIIENNIKNPLLTHINDIPETIEISDDVIYVDSYVSTDVIDVDNNVSTDVIYVDNNVSNDQIEIPNGIKKYPNRSLHDWSLYGNYEEVVWLIENGSNVNEMDEDGRTPLYSSIKYPKIAKALIDNGCSLSSIDIYERTPLTYACQRVAPFKTIELLISSGSDVNANDKFKETPLFHSSMKGRIDVVDLLLQNGADRYHKNHIGKTPYENVPTCFKEMMFFLK